jgi:hypothetical protein
MPFVCNHHISVSVQNNTFRATLLQPARRAAVLGQPTSLSPRWVEHNDPLPPLGGGAQQYKDFDLPNIMIQTFSIQSPPVISIIYISYIWDYHTAKTQYQKLETNTVFPVFPEKVLSGLSPNFHIHVFVSDLFIPTNGLPTFCCRKICGPIL